MKKLFFVIGLVGCSALQMTAQTLDEVFAHPPQEARPLMIWQWMDGVVSADGITADLEAYREAGIGGVQQFLVGGPQQGLICDTANAIGTDNWKALMQHAVSECERLGLSFGTHNCPGWSSSAFPTVTPEYSMQRLVWTDTIVEGGVKYRDLIVGQPSVDPQSNFYRDIALLAMPTDSTVRHDDIIDLSKGRGRLPKGRWRILRIGHTTNGKTNAATAPYGGVGLECDKMSREAVRRYWESYPQMLLGLLGNAAGKTFQRLEIDSYEAGGQEWTERMPDEFKTRRGYDMLKWLPVLAGYTVESAERSKQFSKDYAQTGTELFSENYYTYMAELAHESGLRLLYQPYGTNSSRPFNPINTEDIARRLPDDYFCTEFWYQPSNWGWPSVPRHMDVAHKLGLQRIYAEGFTCWPATPWQEDPASLKAMADRAFCFGVNALMLHAGAQNPWKNAQPGMTFGMWGSWWTPGQTWWQSGGARLLFDYFARCQALLQRGTWVADYRSKQPTLAVDKQQPLLWVHRRDGEADIYFIANPLDSAFSVVLTIPSVGKLPEVWQPETGTTATARAWLAEGEQTRVALHFDEHQSYFIVLRRPANENGTGLALPLERANNRISIDGPWTLHFPAGWDAPEEIALDSLTPWNEHADAGIRYFSGTATYETTFYLKSLVPDIRLLSSSGTFRYILDLGEVKNLAQVSVNGKPVAHLWKKPFRCDVTDYLQEGENTLSIAVTNLWPNRMIGDEQYEDDVEWGDPLMFGHGSAKPSVGRFMKRVPDWLRNGQSRPSQHRKAVVSFKFFEKDAPLLPSGLLGPVEIRLTETLPTRFVMPIPIKK